MSLPAAVAGQANSVWRWLAVSAALLGLAAVLLGAAGSHAIKLADAAARQRWDIALQIHCFHTACLLAMAALSATHLAGRKLLLPGVLQISGTVVFSGSLYLRAAGLLWLPGWITPAGGLILLLGWTITILVLIDSRKL